MPTMCRKALPKPISLTGVAVAGGRSVADARRGAGTSPAPGGGQCRLRRDGLSRSKGNKNERPDTGSSRPCASGHRRADRHRHAVPDAVSVGRPVFRGAARGCCDRRCRQRGHSLVRHPGAHADGHRRYRRAGVARGRGEGSATRQYCLQPGRSAVDRLRASDTRRRLLPERNLHAGDCREPRCGRSRRSLSVLVHAGSCTAVRARGPGCGPAGHRHREARHDGADADRGREHRACAGADPSVPQGRDLPAALR
jgi:hypothetical protein